MNLTVLSVGGNYKLSHFYSHIALYTALCGSAMFGVLYRFVTSRLLCPASMVTWTRGAPGSERVHIIRSNLQWLKEDAAERRSHCMHIRMVEQNHHAISLNTLYAENLDEIYLCVKTGVQSSRGSNDHSSLLIRFKAYYCLGCSFKKPNQ